MPGIPLAIKGRLNSSSLTSILYEEVKRMLVAGRYVHPNSLFAKLSRITDYRFSQWKIYPLNKILSLLIPAAVCGERSLRGMWLWAVNRWEEVREIIST